MIRIGIVGCGRILAAHLQGYRLLREAGVDNFVIAALCSRRAEDAQSYVQRGQGPPQRAAVSDIPGDPLAVGDEYLSDFQPGIPVAIHTDYREMLASGNIDAVNDFSVHGLHHQVASEAFARGLHLLTQKPLAVTVRAARRMVAQAERSGVTFGVFENLRFVPGVRHQQWACSPEGPLGKLQMAIMGNVGTWWSPDLVVAETPWRHDRLAGGGMALDLGPHFFDLIRSVGGTEVASVSGSIQVIEPERYILKNGVKSSPTSCDADDTFSAQVELTSGATATLFGSWAGRGAPTVVGEGPVFYGEGGRITGDRIDLADGQQSSLREAYRHDAEPARQARDFPLGLENDFALAQFDWLQAIKEGRQPECSGREGLIDLACAYAVVESSLAGRRVTISEVLDGSLDEYQKPINAHFGIV
jgi:1,5-anhydro-D-fructose reductase (1,5-anhydro-D-mannitol-forming)